MKKYTFLVYHQDYVPFLEDIRELGVLHVVEKQAGILENEGIQDKLQVQNRLQSAIQMLKKRVEKAKTSFVENINEIDGLELLSVFENKQAKKTSLLQVQDSLLKEIARMEIWGHFDYSNLKNLQEAGYVLRFYACNNRHYEKVWQDKYNAFEIDTLGSTLYFITITPANLKFDIEADLIQISEKSLAELQTENKQCEEKLAAIENDLLVFAKEQTFSLEQTLIHEQNEFEFSKVKLHTVASAENKLMMLEGFTPEEKEAPLQAYLQQKAVFYQTDKPTEADKVPVLLKNNRFARLYEVIGELYDMPNYHEIDLTPFFAPFYMLFFGLCLGDAGYGLILVLLSVFARSKVKDSIKPILSLVTWLGSATVLFGIVSGTFFGINLIESDIPWLTDFKRVMIDANQLFYLSLMLGVVQIMFGMVLKAVGMVRRHGWSTSFSTWGWIIVIIGCGSTYALAVNKNISVEFANLSYAIFGGIGGIFIFLLNDIKRNPLINIGSGLWDTYNMATGLLGDVLSYIRLFALGISSAVMGFVFNSLALNLSGDIPVVSHILMLFILIVGHGINIFMSGLSSFVHPMRLTFVEFYKNSGFEGGGKKYSPFKLKK